VLYFVLNMTLNCLLEMNSIHRIGSPSEMVSRFFDSDT
jgi:hypothetical protein